MSSKNSSFPKGKVQSAHNPGKKVVGFNGSQSKREATPCGLHVKAGTGTTACDCGTCENWRKNQGR